MKSAKTIRCLSLAAFFILLCALLGGIAPASAQINVAKEKKEEGPGIQSFDITFPDAAISYTAKIDGSGDLEKDSRLFGLSFHRPKATNGGWSLWDFLRVKVRAQGDSVAVVEKHLLTSADILEDQQRVLLAFDWKLEEQGADLRVLFAWYPEQPDWIFVKIVCSGDGVFLEQVSLCAFPGNTAGPEERERWMATDKQPGNRLPVDLEEVPTDTEGVVFYNQFAQDDSGCVLVLGDNQRESVKVSGSYSVDTEINLPEGRNEVSFALGGFVEQSAEEVIRVFQMEGARNTRNYLKTIDWTPRMDGNAHESLLKDAEHLASLGADQSALEDYQNLKAEYDSSVANGSNTDLLQSIRKLTDLKLRLIEAELAKLK